MARLPRGHDAALDRTEGSEAFERDIGAVALVMIENRGITALLRDRDRHHLVGEAAFSPRRGGAMVRADRIRVRRLACDAIVTRAIFRGLHHSRDQAITIIRPRHTTLAGITRLKPDADRTSTQE